MEQTKSIGNLSLLLSVIAGFCDTITFVAASGLFSAHVTGNFILFAYDITKHADTQSWVKLLTFPVFIISVISGGWITTNTKNKYTILFIAGIVLTIAGIIGLTQRFIGIDTLWLTYAIAMFIVFAMGLQNVFGRVYSQETYGPTTVMTGNVIKAALDFYKASKVKIKNAEINLELKHQLIIIGGFLTGCILGAVAGLFIGLCGVLFTGIILVIYVFKINSYGK